MKTYRFGFLLLAMLLAMPMTVSAKYYPESPTVWREVYWIGPAPTINNIESLTKAAEQGDLDAQRKLAHHFMDNSSYYKEQAVEWFTRAARQGDAETQRELGDYYYQETPFGLAAAEWYRKAAEQGDVDAQTRLGELYAEGKGVEQDYVEAAKWYRKAAEQGNSIAQGRLGDFYAEGKGVKQDYAEAAKWYSKEAEKEHGYAQKLLGDRFAEGEGVEQDYAEAAKWYSKALENDSNIVKYLDIEKLGDLYAATHNYTEAAKWYHKAVDNKEIYYDNDSQLKLGLCYAFGKGVEQNFSEATKLIKGWIKGFIEDFTKEMGIAVYLLLGLLLLMLISGFTIIYHRNKQLGLAKRIIFALVFSFALTALFSLSISMLMFLISMIINAYSLIASDFLMLFVLSFLTILCLGFFGASLLMIGQPKSTNSISAESENETPENTLMDGKKGRKVKFNKSTVNLISIAAMLLSFLVGFAYYWFTTKALGHEPLSTYLGYQEDPPQFIISLSIFVIALIIGLITIFLLSRLVCGWRNISFKTGDWKRGVSIGFFIINPIKKSRYIKGKVVPFILFGLLPLLVSPFVNSIGLFFLGAIFISSTADGLIPVWKIRKESHDRMIQDIKGENAVFVLDEEQSIDNE